MIVDTSALLAYFDSNEPSHRRCAQAIEGADDELVISPYVVAEVDYLLATRVGGDAERAALTELSSGAWTLASFGSDEIRDAVGVIDRYADQSIGVADASLVVLAERYRMRTIATLDRRHFGVLRPIGGGRFTIVP